MPWRFEANAVLLSAALLALTLLPGCLTREQRWEEFDTERRQEIGVKTKDHYLNEWGKPAKRVKSTMAEKTGRGNSQDMEELKAGKRRCSSHRTES